MKNHMTEAPLAAAASTLGTTALADRVINMLNIGWNKSKKYQTISQPLASVFVQ